MSKNVWNGKFDQTDFAEYIIKFIWFNKIRSNYLIWMCISGLVNLKCESKVNHQMDKKWTVALFNEFMVKFLLAYIENSKAKCFPVLRQKATQILP